MRRSSESRQCPDCGRKSALVWRTWDDGQSAAVRCCRWSPDRCGLTQGEAHRRWIARNNTNPDYVGSNPIPSFARTFAAHVRAANALPTDSQETP